MENLQEDVLTLILSKLEDLSDLCRCAGVAKFFHRLHWPVLVLRRTHHDEERMARLVIGALSSRHMNGLQKLVIKSEQENIGVEKKDWLMLKKSQGSLRTLELNGCFNVPDLWGVIHGFPKLSILKLKNNAFRTPRSTLPISLPGLTTVSIIKSYYINDIQALVRACRASLETLRVECESHIETMDLSITDCPKLEDKLEGLSFTWELELWEIDKLRNNHLYSILSACPMLQTLQLSGGEALKSPVVISCPTITSLNYARKDSRCPDFHDQLLLEPHVLRIECPSLQKLKISGDCCVVADFDVNIPEVTIAERWGYQNVKKVLCLSKSVLHLDISRRLRSSEPGEK
ncbi:hypothetical protein SELMODRAFT_404420 [Selaginella moellendorffii]|uniref:F-box domain-containing protein n=1 Tax=Selaginella moellendorffii TaxID=88036 RepID=D8QV99_SELML|nr:hypothetical protein SELMODRAFT_404420 [Selaginella moellendorffii]